jgi:hypothetical protein
MRGKTARRETWTLGVKSELTFVMARAYGVMQGDDSDMAGALIVREHHLLLGVNKVDGLSY